MAKFETPKITEMSITDIKPYNRNPRNNARSIKLLKKAIKDFGFLVPVTVDKDLVLVTGHSRYFAARELGLDKIPVMVLSNLSPEQVSAFRIADNSSADHTKFDELQLKGKLLEYTDEDFRSYFEGFVFEPINAVQAPVGDKPEAKIVKQDTVRISEELICPHCYHEFEYTITR